MQYNAWQNVERREVDMPDCVDTPINDPEKLEAYYGMVDEQVREDMANGNMIVEILFWE